MNSFIIEENGPKGPDDWNPSFCNTEIGLVESS